MKVLKTEGEAFVIALAGNPNVGKSTVFNALTGMRQHTGNWSGKTVENAKGYCTRNGKEYVIVDIPGSYSLMAHSAEEEIARDLICFGKPDAVVVVCDATCIQRNLNLVLQVIEASKRIIVCVNMLDEARKKNIYIDLNLLSERLGVPVVGMSANKGKGLREMMEAVEKSTMQPEEKHIPLVVYPDYLETRICELAENIMKMGENRISPRWLAARMLDADESMRASINNYLCFDSEEQTVLRENTDRIRQELEDEGISSMQIQDDMVSAFVHCAEHICDGVVSVAVDECDKRDRFLDAIFTSKITGFPIMLLFLFVIFWITIIGANIPSELLANGLFWLGDQLDRAAHFVGIPSLIIEIVVGGVYKVMAWVISVMLPPMAIFFPLFTLLEDFGYLPRIAFNLDRCFQSCAACGKQALTMCMGFGCNAAGVTGCRIIDSPRERLIAIMTNNFVPCNGRFPTIISIITLFLIGGAGGFFGSILGALILVGVIILGVIMTLLISKVLSLTILKGIPSSFTLELPPYRKPQIGRVIIRSVIDRTLKVLGRAVTAAAPAGLIIWVLANISIENVTLLSKLTGFLDPFGRVLGMDGVILTGFILGLPANEIVIPIIVMTYLSQGSLLELEGSQLLHVFVDNGWTWVTAVSTILFSLLHWPCATTCMTIRKETQSLKWTVLSFLLPTICGIVICFLFRGTVSVISECIKYL